MHISMDWYYLHEHDELYFKLNTMQMIHKYNSEKNSIFWSKVNVSNNKNKTLTMIVFKQMPLSF